MRQVQLPPVPGRCDAPETAAGVGTYRRIPVMGDAQPGQQGSRLLPRRRAG